MPKHPAAVDEHTLIAAFHTGAPAAWHYLYSQYARPLLRFARQLVYNDPEAADIVASSFAKLWVKHADFDNLPDIRSFLYVTTRNASVDYLRRLKIRERFLQGHAFLFADAGDDDGTTDYLKNARMMQALLNEASRLPVRTRQVFDLIYYYNLENKAIARQLGLHVRTIQRERKAVISQLQRALQKRGLLP